jgi:low affinity Fe/Cu permease
MCKYVKSKSNQCAHPQGNAHHTLTTIFRKIAQRAGKILGSPWSFIIACVFICTWLISGPYFHYSVTWQLVVNSVTTIVTFLMVFLIQYTQNRDTKALHLKLDELIYVHRKARNLFLEAEEEMDDDEIRRESEAFKMKRGS